MIWPKLIFGGFGRRGYEAMVAGVVLVIAIATVAGALMVVEGAADALARAERNDRPNVVQVMSRFNRALFETPRSGNLQPLTLPVYEPLINPENLAAAAGGATALPRQSFLRNVVFPASFLNVYIFGIEPNLERQFSSFVLARGRFLRSDDNAAAMVDKASARALGVDLGDAFAVRKADGEDLLLTVVGILDRLALDGAPPRTVETPSLAPASSVVSSGVFVTLRTSEQIFGRETLTDALVVARTAADTPPLVDRLRTAFRLEPGVFVVERYSQFRRKVHDFVLTLSFFAAIGAVTAILSGAFVANLLHDVYSDRRRQYATLIALGFSPARAAIPGLGFGLAAAVLGTIAGSLLGVLFSPTHFAMPSLMADLGTIEPRFNLRIVAVVAAVALASVVLGIAPTGWRLIRQSVATSLSENGR